jgi:hypothetical protein
MSAEDRAPPGPEDIAADDAGGSVLGRTAGQTAGGKEGFGYASPEQEQPQGEIAADDAGATAQATQAVTAADVED